MLNVFRTIPQVSSMVNFCIVVNVSIGFFFICVNDLTLFLFQTTYVLKRDINEISDFITSIDQSCVWLVVSNLCYNCSVTIQMELSIFEYRLRYVLVVIFLGCFKVKPWCTKYAVSLCPFRYSICAIDWHPDSMSSRHLVNSFFSMYRLQFLVALNCDQKSLRSVKYSCPWVKQFAESLLCLSAVLIAGTCCSCSVLSDSISYLSDLRISPCNGQLWTLVWKKFLIC